MSIKADARRAKHQVLEQVILLRDQAKLQLHLLSLDARQRWSGLEAEIEALENRASLDGEKATETLREAAHGLTRALSEFITSQLSASAGLATSVRSLMTTYTRACSPDDSLTHAAHLMWEFNCGAVPVVQQERVVGVITDRDICMATYIQGKAPQELRVEVAMSKNVFSCAPDDSLADALSVMANHRVRRLPVLSPDGALLGIIALADIARFARALTNPAVQMALTDALAAISAVAPQQLQTAAE
ncbi:MAG: CBS domain-containing protein [Myxococcales bacterium]